MFSRRSYILTRANDGLVFWYYHSSFAIYLMEIKTACTLAIHSQLQAIKSSHKAASIGFCAPTQRVCSRAAPTTTSLLDFYILGASYITYKGENTTFKYFKMWKSQVKKVTPYGEPCSPQSFTVFCFPNKNQDTLPQVWTCLRGVSSSGIFHASLIGMAGIIIMYICIIILPKSLIKRPRYISTLKVLCNVALFQKRT